MKTTSIANGAVKNLIGIERKNEIMFKLVSEDSVLTTYGKWHENDKLTFFFNKELEQVDIEYQVFERNADCLFVPQGENNHSCKYGYWKVEAPCLSMEDIEFLYNKSKELFDIRKEY